MRGFLANTDPDWFDLLAGRADPEVNFWTPSTRRAFRSLSPGEPLLFRLKAPRNKVGGFGIFERYTELPHWLAWQTFGVANGVSSLAALDSRLEAIRRRNGIDGPAVIGCIVLASPVFLAEELWVDLPRDWKPQIVSGRGYDLTQGEGARVWRDVLARSAAQLPVAADEEPRYGPERPFQPRLGQAGFRLAVLDAYGRACAVTNEHSLPVLESAHIQGYAEGGPHDVQNGLLLRSDVHRLFDSGYVSVTEDRRFAVSRRLATDFRNGKTYYQMEGQPLQLPRDPSLRPAPELLRWHRENRFLG